MDFLKLPIEKLKNKVICDKHFQETSFMNYTRSKLNKTTAVPTIYIDSNDEEIDLLESPTTFVIENKEKKSGSGYLITNSSSREKSKIDIDEADSGEQQIIVMKSSTGPTSAKRLKTELPTQKPSEMRILNKLPPPAITPGKQLISFNQIKEAIQKSSTSQQCAKTKVKLIEKPKVFNTKVIKHEILPSIINEVEQFEVLSFLPEEVSSPSKPLTLDLSLSSSSSSSSLQEIKTLIKDVAEIKSLLSEKIPPTAQMPSTSTGVSSESNITPSHLNKIQLFNGIKRYLSPSLIALLRLEIFSAPNREYKKDEKIICDELLKLGDEVYDFFSEEWRLRLPSKDQVKSWQSDDLIDDDAS